MKELLLHLKGTKARPRFDLKDICYPRESHWIRYNTDNEQKDVKDFKRYTSKVRQTDKLLYIRHTYFVDDMAPNVYKYINMVKHPVDQFISWFYYERHGWIGTPLKPSWTHDVEEGTRDLTIQQCISGNFKSCVNPSRNSEFFGYFCGHHDFCFEAGSEKALQQSKLNIEKKFIAIGLTSELENSLKLYESVLPKWFEGMYEYYDTVVRKQKSGMKTAGMVKPNNETRKYLEEKMKYEIELYEWMIQRFHEHLKILKIE